MIPTARFALFASLGLPLALVGLFGGASLDVALAFNGLLLVVGVLDRLATESPVLLEVSREAPARWVQGRAERVELKLRWRGRRSARLLVRDIAPPSFDVVGATWEARLGAGEGVSAAYQAVARERGVQDFGAVAVRSRGPFGLVVRQSVSDLRRGVRVYPDLLSLSAREASLVAPSLWRRGARRGFSRGEGREFYQLRDYVPGDDVRLVDWKAFAHRGRLAVREVRAERNQRVLLLLDAGRLMTAPVQGRLRFDWAVQAAGRLARVALAAGDEVGVATFSREVKSSLAASRSPGQVGKVAEMLSEARPDLDEPDLARALGALLRGHGRRSLVVLFTELADPRSAESALRHVGALAPRHLGLVVTLSDVDLEAERHLRVTDADSAYRRVAADELWRDLNRVRHALESRGALVLSARADALAAEAVERYVEIKRRGRL